MTWQSLKSMDVIDRRHFSMPNSSFFAMITNEISLTLIMDYPTQADFGDTRQSAKPNSS
jgi:hypothetical protein